MSDTQNMKIDDYDTRIAEQSECINLLKKIVSQQSERIRLLAQDRDLLKALVEAKAEAEAFNESRFSENASLGPKKKARKKPKPKRRSTGRKLAR